jgi:hypothetical protein
MQTPQEPGVRKPVNHSAALSTCRIAPIPSSFIGSIGSKVRPDCFIESGTRFLSLEWESLMLDASRLTVPQRATARRPKMISSLLRKQLPLFLMLRGTGFRKPGFYI